MNSSKVSVEAFRRFFLLPFFFYFQVFAEETIFTREEIVPGAEYIHKQVPEIPWSIHVVKIERNRRDLKIVSTMPKNNFVGLTATTEQIKALPAQLGRPIAAINGDFFSWRKGPYQGDPQGLQIAQGELTSAPAQADHEKTNDSRLDGVCFWIDGFGEAHIEKVVSQLTVSWPNGFSLPVELNEERKDNNTAILYTPAAGTSTRTTNGVELILKPKFFGKKFPLRAGETYKVKARLSPTNNVPLKRNQIALSLGANSTGLPPFRDSMTLKISTATNPDLKNVSAAIGGGPQLVHEGHPMKSKIPERNPRCAVGFSKTHIYFVVVDGRRKGVSDGMTFFELAKELVSLGCEEAMNLDGGGSATIWVDGNIRNQPSDNHERAVANALVLLKSRK